MDRRTSFIHPAKMDMYERGRPQMWRASPMRSDQRGTSGRKTPEKSSSTSLIESSYDQTDLSVTCIRKTHEDS